MSEKDLTWDDWDLILQAVTFYEKTCNEFGQYAMAVHAEELTEKIIAIRSAIAEKEVSEKDLPF